MGSVVLAVTGAEALYADMGHFGRRPIKFSWLYFVMPALLLNYMGQGAMLLSQTPAEALETVKNPFFFLAPEALRLPLVILATMATIIASQAVISGAFSVTQQAIQLGFIPRLRITHTSEHAAGQIYIPVVNWALMIMVILLVLMFGSSSNLAAAYGIAVTGAMLIDGVLISVVLLSLWKWPSWKAIPLLAIFFTIDMLYFGANLLKVPDGGWFPLLIGAIAFTLLTTWAQGPQADDRPDGRSQPADRGVHQVGRDQRHPRARNRGVHDHVDDRRAARAAAQPQAQQGAARAGHAADRADRGRAVRHQPSGGSRPRIMAPASTAIIIRYGFMEEIDVPAALAQVKSCGPQFKMMDTSFFLARQTLIASARPGMAIWREKLFAWMLRNAESAMEFFKLPTNRVVELGSQVEI